MEQFKEFMMKAWDFLNAPLPIVGVSLLIILIFAWKVFASSSFGKKQLKKLNDHFTNLKTDWEKEKNELETKKQALENEVKSWEERFKALESDILEICDKSYNQRLKELGERIKNGKGKETVDSGTDKE